jgi:sugar phosphate isomerase/epimerase
MSASVLAVTPSGDSAVRLREILAAVTSGLVGIDFDPAAFVLSGQSPEDALDTLKGMLVNFRVRDALRDVEGGGVETAVGQGGVPWEEMLARLEEIEYSGWLTIDRTQGDKSRDVARAVDMLMG